MVEKRNAAYHRISDRWLAVVGGAGLAVFYFVFRSQNHPIDSVLYALAAEVREAYPFFHWHHLLYTPLTTVALKLARAFGYAGGAFAPMAAVSAVAAGAAAGLFYLTLRRLGARLGIAALATAGLAFSAAWWYFAGEAEVLALISLFIAGATYLLAGRPVAPKKGLVLGVWLAVGTLCHQAVFLFTPVAFVLLAAERGNRPGRLAAFALSYAVLTAVPYYLIPYLYYDVRGWGDWLNWVTYYASWGDWGHFTRERLARGFVTMLAAVVSGPVAGDVGRAVPPADFLRRYGPAVLIWAGLCGTVVAAAGALWRERRVWLVAAVLWFVGFHFFFTWWEPENVEWWIATTMPLWLLFGLALGDKRIPLAFRACAALAIIGAAAFNFGRVIQPATEPGRNDAEAAARGIVAATKPGDAVFMSHLDVNAWVDYLSRHTRKLSAPFMAPAPGDAASLEARAKAGFPEYAVAGSALYFTNFEWDDPGGIGVDAAAARELRVPFFKMILAADPVTLLRFPGGERVLYRYGGYAAEARDVQVMEAETPGSYEEGVALLTSKAAADFEFTAFRKGEYEIFVEARGTPARGTWPHMEVSADGWPLGVTAVDAAYWRFYRTSVSCRAGPHRLSVKFLNDYYDPSTGENRDLFVNRVIVFRESSSGKKKRHDTVFNAIAATAEN
ncbi:MAG: carbohydrate-binding domain-containing protein [Candidatus Zixiibacteriota bacterium]|jgi:hypothetical protein